MQLILRSLALLSFALLSGCFPEHQAKLRREKPVTINVSGIGFAHHPKSSKRWGYGLNTSYDSKSDWVGWGNLSTRSEDPGVLHDEKIKRAAYGVELDWHFFPSERSGFNLGFSASVRAEDYEFRTRRQRFGMFEPEYTRMSLSKESGYVGLHIGWFQMYESGVTLGTDIGPKLRVHRRLHARTSDELIADPTATAADVEEVGSRIDEKVITGASAFLGVSF